MEYVDVTLKCAKETYELGKGLEGVVIAIKNALKDGWQPGTDLPMIAVQSLNALAPAVQGVEKLPEEAKADVLTFQHGIYCGLAEVPHHFLKKPVDAPQG